MESRIRLEPGGVVEELPGEGESLGEELGEGFDAESFGGVVPGVEKVYSEFFGGCVGPMGALARDEGVNALRGDAMDVRAGATGHDAHVAGEHGTTWGEEDVASDSFLDVVAKDFAVGLDIETKSDRLSGEGEEWGAVFKAEGSGELGIVSESRMGVQREVGAVEGHVGLEEEAEFSVGGTRGRGKSSPEKPVVDDQEVNARGGRIGDHSLAGIHGSADAGQAARILDLEAVECIRVIAVGGDV